MIIKTYNNLTQTAPKTYLSNAAEVAGTNFLKAKNTNALTNGWAIQIGETGQEQAEVVIGTVASGTSIDCATTRFPHNADTPVYFIKFDQVVFERSTAGTTGAATPMTNGTITIQPDSLYTIFDDTSGSASYAYRTYFRNSALLVNSTESDWITPAGFSFYSLAALRERVKNRLWSSDFLDDPTLNDWLNEYKDELTNSAIQVNEDYALGTVDVSFGTAGMGTVSATDFKQMKRLWVTYNGSDYFVSTKMDSNSFTPTQQFNSTTPQHYYQGDNIFGIKPEQSGGTARAEYYKLNARMVNDTDELPVPMRGYTKGFIDYCESLAFMKDGKAREAATKLSSAMIVKSQYTSELTPRDKTGQEYINLTESISGDDYF